MIFAKHLREGIRSRKITCTVRIWHRARVRVGGIYRMEDGHVVVVDLLKTAKHGSGTNVYLIEFEYVGPC